MSMTNDSELEALQCYPFHWPEKWDVFVNGKPIDIYAALGAPHDMLQFEPLSSRALEAYTWGAGSDSQIIKDLLDMAGIPADEEGGNDATMGVQGLPNHIRQRRGA